MKPETESDRCVRAAMTADPYCPNGHWVGMELTKTGSWRCPTCGCVAVFQTLAAPSNSSVPVDSTPRKVRVRRSMR